MPGKGLCNAQVPALETGVLYFQLLLIILSYSLQKFMHGKDIRMRGLDEMMSGIKTIKYNSYEELFVKKVRSPSLSLSLLRRMSRH